MTNEEKRELLKKLYQIEINSSPLSEDERRDLIIFLSKTLPTKLYHYTNCTKESIQALKEKKAWFSAPTTWYLPFITPEVHNETINIMEEDFNEQYFNTYYRFLESEVKRLNHQDVQLSKKEVKELFFDVFIGKEDFNPYKMMNYLTPLIGKEDAKIITIEIQQKIKAVNEENNKEDEWVKTQDEKIDRLKHYISLSVSETYDSSSEWNQFSARGKGFCIGYEFSQSKYLSSPWITSLFPITYGGFAFIDLRGALQAILTSKDMMKSLENFNELYREELFISKFTKDIDSEDEKEWMFAIFKKDIESQYIDFNYAKSLYLGDLITKKNKEALLAIAKKQHLTVYQRVKDGETPRGKNKYIYVKIDL